MQASQAPQALPSECGIVAGAGQRIVDAQSQSAANDLALGQCDQRRVDRQLCRPSTPALVARLAMRS